VVIVARETVRRSMFSDFWKLKVSLKVAEPPTLSLVEVFIFSPDLGSSAFPNHILHANTK
jgi:hypothetical protein